MSTNPGLDDATSFQNSALAAASDVVDSPDDSLGTEDPISNNALHDRHLPKGAHERYAERERLQVQNVAFADPNNAMPHRINGRRLTAATRSRDRDMLEHPNISSKSSSKRAR